MSDRSVDLYDHVGRKISPVKDVAVPWLLIILLAFGCGHVLGLATRPIMEKAFNAERAAYGSRRVNADSLDEWRGPLGDAVAEWRKVLPGWTIPLPNLELDKNGTCQTSSELVPIACASKSKYTIWIARDQTLWDKKTVMMHEMAHVLGSPHIEGDELMDSNYQGKLEAPTPLSVDVVKFRLEHR